MGNVASPRWKKGARAVLLLLGYGVAAAGLGAAGTYVALSQWRLQGPPVASGARDKEEHGEDHAGGDAHETHDEQGHDHEEGHERRVEMPEQKGKTAGIRVATVARKDLVARVRVTGKVAINEDRISHIYPLVSGRVHEVNVQFGDRVKAGQVLAVIDSQEVGRAKLTLYQRTLETRLAEVNHKWQHEIATNTLALIAELSRGVPIAEIQVRFKDKPMGNYRERLLSAYSQLYKARVDYKRLKELSEKGITAGKSFIDAEAARDAAEAAFWAAVEQIKFQVQRDELSARQELEQASTAEAVSRELLTILGYHQIATEDIDPAVQGECISHYEVKAPFDGVVIGKDIVLLDHVDPKTRMFSVADFSTVWVRADIYEKYLPLLRELAGKTIQFHSQSYPGRTFQANVFYAGEIVDEKTRTLDMRALAPNPEGLLKPGMFVQLELPSRRFPDVLQVPSSAVTQLEDETVVFVPVGEGAYEARPVKVGRTAGGAVEILDGLEEGESVVVQGVFALKSELLGASVAEAGHQH